MVAKAELNILDSPSNHGINYIAWPRLWYVGVDLEDCVGLSSHE